MQKALGLIETIGLTTAIEAADAAVKAANVVLLGYENTKGGGKIVIKLVGDVGAVQAAVSAGVASASRIGKIYSYSVIPRPHDEIAALIRQVDRGKAKEPPAPAPAPTPEAVELPAAEAAPVVAITPIETPAEASSEIAPYNQCAAITKSGERCTLPARAGSQYCSVHRKLEQVAG